MVAWGVCFGAPGFVLPCFPTHSRPRLGSTAAHHGAQAVHNGGSMALTFSGMSVAVGILNVTARRSTRRPSTLQASKTDEIPEVPEVARLETAAAEVEDSTHGDAMGQSQDTVRSNLKVELLRIAAASSRGERVSPRDLEASQKLAASLEELNPTASPTLAPQCVGTWELVFADTQLFRSSPFFMAGRALCREGEEASRYDWFCDMHRAALAFSNIGKVRQVISSTAIVSEFEVQVGAAPVALGYPINIDGAIVSTASIATNSGDGFELLMGSVEIKGSNVPLLRQVLDSGLVLRTEAVGSALESVVRDRELFPTPLFRTTYLDSDLRISRDQDGKLFVYSRVSDATVPSNYEDVPSDLGIEKLLRGAVKTVFG
eukprot:TRINITY_DN48488_c0_g1_i1.p1 TRINITY_DN48488_c0_g1~~TRINITY_DN48488_c0_g1_i1.p1  ORF type:complete len:403 (-),score=46.76 TRINITY_DN48488_c0_g1_i1:67-1188(-)